MRPIIFLTIEIDSLQICNLVTSSLEELNLEIFRFEEENKGEHQDKLRYYSDKRQVFR
jgi:hypothetical protein